MDKKQILALSLVAIAGLAIGVMVGKRKPKNASSGADGDFVVDRTKRTWDVEGGQESKANMLEVNGGMKETYGNMLEASGPGTPIDPNPKGGNKLNYPRNRTSNMLDVTGVSSSPNWPDHRKNIWG